MKMIEVRNVCEALPAGVRYLLDEGVPESSRAGDVLVSPVPVTTVYERPLERVLTSPVRDANPFFHLAEAMWMLAGRDDVAFLNLFIKNFGDRFSDEGVVHGAYGHRWRRALGFDQLGVVIEKLRSNSRDRQAVIQMWDATPGTGSDDLRGTWKDRPCNTQVMLRVRQVPGDHVTDLKDKSTFVHVFPSVLDMMVTCRSNDIVLGAYGANAVHFGFLHEYVAQMVGVEVGTLYQMSWNYHMYVDEMERLARRALYENGEAVGSLSERLARDIYLGLIEHQALITDASAFDAECARLLVLHEQMDWEIGQNIQRHVEVGRMKNAFLVHTVWPMLTAHGHHRNRNGASDPMSWMNMVRAADWRLAGTEWLRRRAK